MMETDLTLAIQPPEQNQSAGAREIHPTETPLAALLAQAAAPPQLQVYCGALTPRELDAPEKEIAALLAGVAVHDLGWLRRVAVRGEDRLRWLNGMVTNTVSGLGENAGSWNFVLNAQGRIQGDLHVWRGGDAPLSGQEESGAGEADFELVIAADQYEKLLAHLDHFIIMDDVELVPQSLDAEGRLTGETALGLSGPLAADLLARLGLPALPKPLTSARALWNGLNVRVVRDYGVLAPHYELWVRAAQIPALWKALVEAGEAGGPGEAGGAGATLVGAATLEAFRIAEGIPAYGIDIAERDLAQETSQMRALSFDKGCYLGHEIVERIRSRGSVHRHLRPLELFGPLPAAGTELVMENGRPAGKITSAAELPLATGTRIFALGMIPREAEFLPQRPGPAAGNPEVRNQPFTYIAGTATGSARILTAPPALEPGKQN
jgi:folate-binding protein YgfZ